MNTTETSDIRSRRCVGSGSRPGSGVAPRSYEYDEGMVGRIVRVLGVMRVQDVTVRDVRRLLRETAMLAERTRYGMLVTFQQVMKMAVTNA
jgi:Mg/Co/Ni transporter MgtE